MCKHWKILLPCVRNQAAICTLLLGLRQFMISLPTASIDLKLLQVTEECITCLKIAPKLIILGKEGPLLFKNL
jgi:hypothetical protein